MPWEFIAYALIVAVALTMRLWDLSGRAYHYDESIHAFDSWQLFKGHGYMHSPWSHGPGVYDFTAGGFLLFGGNLARPRVFPASFGTALVLLPFFLRDYLGKWGTLAAALLLTFSPSLLYLSRFVRAEAFTVFFDVGIAVCFWRYLKEQRKTYLYVVAVLLTLDFSTGETSYLNFAAFGSFLFVWWLRGWLPILWSGAEGKVGRLIDGLRPSRQGPVGSFGLLLAALALPLFGALVGVAIDKIFHFGGFKLVDLSASDPTSKVGAPLGGNEAYVAAAIIAAALFAISFAVGVYWRRRVWLVAFGTFWVIFFVLHTTFMTNMVGMGTGVWQSLGYWIAQHGVQRAGQPWYYYLMQLGTYEFLPLLFGIAAIVWLVVRRGAPFAIKTLVIVIFSALLATAIELLWNKHGGHILYVAMPLGLGLLLITYFALERGNPFDWFLVHWALLTLLLFTVFGEKMPWLTTHIAAPMALLAARFIGQLVTQVEWRTVVRRGAVVLLWTAPLLMAAGIAIVASLPGYLPWHEAPGGWARTWSMTGAVIYLLVFLATFAYVWWRLGNKASIRLVALSIVGLLAFFTVRAATQAAYANADDPRELIVYSQLSPDVARIAADIEQRDAVAFKQTGKHLVVLADTADAAFGPWRWYLRNMPGVQYVDMTSSSQEINADVLLLSSGDSSKVSAVQDKYTTGERITFLQWFNPFQYQHYTAHKFFDDITS
ncbi:MAG: TIGR03663 family protein, partial [Chloroflexi bacterium]|nr:TIGR03663 family protein [Chloroflexota bacterium]